MKELLENLKKKGFKLFYSWSGCKCLEKKRRRVYKESYPDVIEIYDVEGRLKDEVKVQDIIDTLLFDNRKVYIGFSCPDCGYWVEMSFWLEKIRK